MSGSGQAAGGGSPARGRAVLVGALVVVVAVAAAAVAGVLLTRGGGGKPAAATTKAPAVAADGGASGCDSYGPAWVRSYNKQALAQGNPVKMLAACCRPTGKAGVHHCLIKVTLRGTPKTNIGCESVDLGPDGLPAGIGKHENCALLKDL